MLCPNLKNKSTIAAPDIDIDDFVDPTLINAFELCSIRDLEPEELFSCMSCSCDDDNDDAIYISDAGSDSVGSDSMLSGISATHLFEWLFPFLSVKAVY